MLATRPLPLPPFFTPTPFPARRRRSYLRPSPVLSAAGSSPPTAAVDSFTKNSGYVFQTTPGGASPADGFIDYDPAKIASLYRRKPLLLARRLLHIASAFGRWFALRYLDSLLDRSDQMFKVRASELRRILVELGPRKSSECQLIHFSQKSLLSLLRPHHLVRFIRQDYVLMEK